MEKFNLLKYTKKTIKELESEGLYVTHLNIAYKVINYYENNFIDIIKLDDDYLLDLVNKVYEQYIENDGNDDLDRLMESVLSKE
ncbi:MAG: hypothetical protein RBQ97_07960 [Acholeplasma sp.]|nr:hypothetical protein [Acholeplasma sp.]